MNAEDIIKLLKLSPHPEGGFFRETYRSDAVIKDGDITQQYGAPRNASTGIYYLLTASTVSAMHRLKTDEVFHFYLGDPVQQLWLCPDGSVQQHVLGSGIDSGEHPQLVVPKDIWQGSRLVPGGKFALLGCTVAPGFDFADFEVGQRAQLSAEFPSVADEITKLTK